MKKFIAMITLMLALIVVAPGLASADQALTYTISEQLISPENNDGILDSTSIDIEFSEPITDYKIEIQSAAGTNVHDFDGGPNPMARTWDGTNDVTDAFVADGVYSVKVSWTNADLTPGSQDLTEKITVDNTAPTITAGGVSPIAPDFSIRFTSTEVLKEWSNAGMTNIDAINTKADVDGTGYTVVFSGLTDKFTYPGITVSAKDLAGNKQTTTAVGFTTSFTKSFTAAATQTNIRVSDEGNTVATIAVELVNTGETPVTVSADGILMSNYLFQELDSSNSYIYDSDVNEYRSGFYVDTANIVWSFPETFSGKLGTTDTTDSVILTGTLTIAEEALPEQFGRYQSDFAMLGQPDNGDEIELLGTSVVYINPAGYNQRSKLKIDTVDYEDTEPYFRTEQAEVTVTIESNYDEKIKSIEVTLSIPELDYEESASKFSLSDKNEERDVVFKIDIDDKAEQGDYPMLIYVTGETETSSNIDITIDTYDNSNDLQIDVESDDLIVEAVTLDEDDYKAGDAMSVKVDVLNIGDDEQEDIRVRMKCNDLGITELSEVYDKELKPNKDHSFVFNLGVPSGAKDGDYFCTAEILYDGYQSQADDDDVGEHLTKDFTLTVKGGLGTGDIFGETADITGTSTATGVANSATKFNLQLKNTASAGSETFELDVEGYTSWATVSVEPSGLTIPAGTSVPFYVYLTPKEGVTGTKTATVLAYVDDEIVGEKTLTVNVGGASGDGIQVTGLGNSVTGAFAGPLDMPTAIVISSIVAGIVVLGGIYMYTIGKKLQ
jgi:flagellar hook assembly protein FlgD